MKTLIIGSIKKILVKVVSVSGVYLSQEDVSFSCDFYANGKYNQAKVTIDKSDVVFCDDDGAPTQVDSNNFYAIVDTQNLPTGRIHCKMSVDFTDPDTNILVKEIFDIASDDIELRQIQ